MKQVWLFAGICIQTIIGSLKAQNIYFPKASLRDSIELSVAMKNLAHTVIDQMGAGGQQDYRFLCPMHFLNGNFDLALSDLDSFRHQLVVDGRLPDKASASGFYFLYSTYIRAVSMEANTKEPNIDTIFKGLFRSGIVTFNEPGYELAVRDLGNPISETRGYYLEQVKETETNKTDSITMDEAYKLALVYFDYIAESHYTDIARNAIREMDAARYIIQDSVRVPMRDGAYLSAVIVRDKSIRQPQPVVMMGNIYASSTEIDMAKAIVKRGYTGIIVNTRGKYDSNIPVVAWDSDANDMYDAIDWISKESWCNGKIGMYGGSYLGFTQWAATKHMHPALKTIVPQVAAAPGIDFPMHNSIFTTYGLRWLQVATSNRLSNWEAFYDMDHWDSTFNHWYKAGLPFRQLDLVEGKRNATFQRWLDHPAYDAYWQKMIPYREEFNQINIPVLSITGYFDGDQLGALYYYNEHHKWNKKANHYLVIGPYDHGGAQGAPTAVVSGYKVDSAALIDISGLVFQWFDYVLKDSSKPSLLENKVNYEVMGTDKWQHRASLRDMNNDTLRLYCQPLRAGKFYRLTKSKADQSHRFVFSKTDFKNRDYEEVKDTYSMMTDSMEFGDNLHYISERFDRDFSINGSILLKFLTSINKKDMDLSIAYTLLQPDSTYFTFTSAIQRASYARDGSHRNLLTPGKVQPVTLKSNFTSIQIKKGSRLILSVAVLKSPNVEINYGTGKNVADENLKDARGPLLMRLYGNSEIDIPVYRGRLSR